MADAASGDETAKLTFEEISKLQERKAELKAGHTEYLDAHPELKTVLNDFMTALLSEKPEDVVEFARSHFALYKK